MSDFQMWLVRVLPDLIILLPVLLVLGMTVWYGQQDVLRRR